ncbi:membrane protein YczE [Lysinibacter cavernae]|uniref:Putative membrane protein YczE n=1 Tax=Lysinibacter cavernae TaxID=1640652 RepID=A0A7X5R0H8_9MICO|nr:hypothetical protein [Lysinibacter cavernae]NIH53414.1 putative membrane protein YczE [Lysinibacter cavernae]
MVFRLVRLGIGLILFGFACALMIDAALGLDPWTVFAQGIAIKTGMSIGLVTVLSGAVVLLFWIPLRQKPGVGTVLNLLAVGPAIEWGLLIFPTPVGLLAQIGTFVAGLLLLAVASGLYIGAGFGPGPRDGLMTGIHARTGWPIWVGRTMVEVTVLGIGWLLGGNVGFGTVAFALFIGPLCNITIPLLRFGYDPKKPATRAVREPLLLSVDTGAIPQQPS